MDNVAAAEVSAPWEIYRLDMPPRSAGRVLLSEFLQTYTVLQHGIGHDQIADAFTGKPEEAGDTALIKSAVRLLGSLLLNGTVRSYSRPMGGGQLQPLEPNIWELDDFLPRFATCALDPRRPFDANAAPTHRIFVDEEAIQLVFDACCADIAAPARGKGVAIIREDAAAGDLAELEDEGFIRMPDLKAMVGMSSNTIYDRIRDQRFPAPVKNGSRISAWRRSEVREWLNNPR